MIVLSTIGEVSAAKIEGCALVPTMGALHTGHLNLVQRAKSLNFGVAVSIFVNPTQFGANEDFAKYPRPLASDLEMLEAAGVDWVFTPTVEDVYPSRSTVVSVTGVTELYEGAVRPGHFDGVTTIVCKLFQIFRPRVALFGLKDLQQCVVIRQMVQDLNIRVALDFFETVREEDGLAKSSRNVYLSKDDRTLAPEIYRQMTLSSQKIKEGSSIATTLSDAVNALADHGFSVDYFDLIDINNFKATEQVGPSAAIVAAARLGSTRLIDSILLFPTSTFL